MSYIMSSELGEDMNCVRQAEFARRSVSAGTYNLPSYDDHASHYAHGRQLSEKELREPFEAFPPFDGRFFRGAASMVTHERGRQITVADCGR